ncbi:MAG TPA: GyrI-like domain-containing protein [Draconibacterium sp.]|nr:GyrI-like domain-containing protein [Draconibacterium sp.]
MQPRIEIIPEKKLVGKHITTSLAKNKTQQLWKSFMKQRSKINNTVGTEFYSLQCYPESYFELFNPASEFEKWALIEVSNFDEVPKDMETYTLPEGLYAVFQYHGSASTADHTFRYIFETWLPNSIYKLDQRPHFEVLGEKYKNEDANSEEEIWIPIK